MVRLYVVILVLIAALSTASTRVNADQSANAPLTALEWASNEPVTLLDLGMLRLRQDIQLAGQVLYENGRVAGAPLSGVFYDWRTRKIETYLTVRAKPGRERPGMCEEFFFQVVGDIVSGGTAAKKKPEWYIENLFTHETFRGFGRPQNFAEQMLDTVNFEVTIMPAGSD